MKKHLLAISVAAALLAPQAVGAEGFAVNEWSAEGMAMGGARMFAENDAANMAYNPASITKIKGEVAKISATYLSPHGKYKCYDSDGKVNSSIPGVSPEGNNRVHPAWAPGSYYVRQINEKEWIGMGAYSRFGNACQFEAGSLPGTNNTSAKINGISMGVNYARKMDNKWSASLGAEVNYIGLQYDKTPFLTKDALKQLGVNDDSAAEKMQGFHHMHLEGESYALGWNAAINYAFDDKNEMGIVYRSAVNHSMEADLDTTVSPMGPDFYHNAYGFVTLPESVMIGYGHKFNDKTRVELNGTWTRWSRFDKLNIVNDISPLNTQRNWSDGWRYAIGVEHKLSDKYSLLAGIAHDESSIPDYPEVGADFMVPTGTRTTFTIGTQYHDDRQTLAFTIGYMKVGDLHINKNGHMDAYDHADMYDSYTKMFSISYQYNF